MAFCDEKYQAKLDELMDNCKICADFISDQVSDEMGKSLRNLTIVLKRKGEATWWTVEEIFSFKEGEFIVVLS